MKEKAVTVSGKSRKWKLWKSSSASRSSRASDAASDTSSVADGFSTAVAAVARAPLKDFKMVKQEWAAIRIQTAFRGFLVTQKRPLFYLQNPILFD